MRFSRELLAEKRSNIFASYLLSTQRIVYEAIFFSKYNIKPKRDDFITIHSHKLNRKLLELFVECLIELSDFYVIY